MAQGSPKILKAHYTLTECVQNYSLNIPERIIYVNSEGQSEAVGESGTDFQMFTRFLKNLDILNTISEEPVKVKTANIGGDWNYGMAMYDAIRHSRSPIDFYLYAYACSMGSIIPQAARTRYISANADFLVHLGGAAFEGNLKTVNANLEFYNTKTPVMLDIYARRCVTSPFFSEKQMTEADIAAFIAEQVDKKDEWWMTSQEAIHYGFADKLI
jgi:ATP-dependent protease ClpP protease subunit